MASTWDPKSFVARCEAETRESTRHSCVRLLEHLVKQQKQKIFFFEVESGKWLMKVLLQLLRHAEAFVPNLPSPLHTNTQKNNFQKIFIRHISHICIFEFNSWEVMIFHALSAFICLFLLVSCMSVCTYAHTCVPVFLLKLYFKRDVFWIFFSVSI